LPLGRVGGAAIFATSCVTVIRCPGRPIDNCADPGCVHAALKITDPVRLDGRDRIAGQGVGTRRWCIYSWCKRRRTGNRAASEIIQSCSTETKGSESNVAALGMEAPIADAADTHQRAVLIDLELPGREGPHAKLIAICKHHRHWSTMHAPANTILMTPDLNSIHRRGIRDRDLSRMDRAVAVSFENEVDLKC
jgi:hypothetical protein